MYESHWGFTERPFSNNFDARYFYRSQTHEEALNRLHYALDSQMALFLLMGPHGCGKTFMLKSFQEAVRAKGCRTTYVVNPNVSASQLSEAVFTDLGFTSGQGRTGRQGLAWRAPVADRFRDSMAGVLEEGKRLCVVIDEAHLVSDRMALEEVRLLLNYDLGGKNPFFVVLSGQPSLRWRILDTPSLYQRVEINYSIQPFTFEDTRAYLRHRLSVAGCTAQVFEAEAVEALHEASAGVARTINTLAELCLLMGAGEGLKEINSAVVAQARDEVRLVNGVAQGPDFVGNPLSRTLHLVTCIYAPEGQGDRTPFTSVSEAVEAGYSLCNSCLELYKRAWLGI